MRFLFLLLFCSSTLACEKPITINYGPFVSLLVVEQFFGGSHHSLAEKTGCKVNFQLHKNFDDYLLSLFTREYPIALTPGPYHDVMVQLGYKLISTESSSAPRKHYLIVKKNRNINNLNDLVGRKVLVLSPLSSSGSFLLNP